MSADDNKGPTSHSAGVTARRAGGPRAAVILGNDAMVVALPATPLQLARACAAAGFDLVVPPSWGDELVADGYLEQLARRPDDAVVACACPHVAALLGRSAHATQPRSVAIAAPPVAAARYLRLVYGKALLITYVGDCPGASDPSIDARFTPAGFLASLHRQGVTLDTTPMPAELDDANTARWRRHRSMPGGLPTRRFLARPPVDRLLREVDASLADATVWKTSRFRVLLDLSDAAGCACGGNRARVEETEPSRSAYPILVAPPGLSLLPEPTPVRSRGIAHPTHAAHTLRPPPPVAPPREQATSASESESPARVAPTPKKSRRTAAPPVTTDSGIADPPTAPPSAPAQRPATPPTMAARGARAALTPKVPRVERRSARVTVTLVAIPAVVLAITAALGIAAYVAAAANARPSAPPTRARSMFTGDAAARDSATRSPASTAGDSAAVPLPQSIPVAPAPPPDSARTRPPSPSRTTPSRVTPRPRARREPELVPGWLPQGQKAWTPADTLSRRRPDTSGSTKPRSDTVPRT